MPLFDCHNCPKKKEIKWNVLKGCVTKDGSSFSSLSSRFVCAGPSSNVSEQNEWGDKESRGRKERAPKWNGERRKEAQPQCFYRKWDEHRASKSKQG